MTKSRKNTGKIASEQKRADAKNAFSAEKCVIRVAFGHQSGGQVFCQFEPQPLFVVGQKLLLLLRQPFLLDEFLKRKSILIL